LNEFDSLSQVISLSKVSIFWWLLKLQTGDQDTSRGVSPIPLILKTTGLNPLDCALKTACL
jgi:hypothetical protein